MCRTVHAVLSTIVCGIQMLVRVFMTILLMIENIIRMILQTLYNFISFMLQMISLIPICMVFLLTAKLKCFLCGGGSACPVNRSGACDCIISILAIIILFFIFRATGVLDKIFYSMGYAKAAPRTARFIPLPGDISEYSRKNTDYEYMFTTIEQVEDGKEMNLVLFKNNAVNAKVPQKGTEQKISSLNSTATTALITITSTTNSNWTTILYPML